MKIQFDEKGKYYTDIVSKDALPATVQTQTHRIRGNIYVREEERVKDALEKSGHYLAVTDATIYDAQDQALYHCDFLALNQDHIVWVLLDVDVQPGEIDPS
jgi:hypothetical protein